MVDIGYEPRVEKKFEVEKKEPAISPQVEKTVKENATDMKKEQITCLFYLTKFNNSSASEAVVSLPARNALFSSRDMAQYSLCILSKSSATEKKIHLN